MTTHADRKAELLKIIAAEPGIAPGVLMARSVTCGKQETLTTALKGLMTDDGLALRTGMGEQTRYFLTERGAAAAAEYGYDVAPTAVATDAIAGAGETDEPALACMNAPEPLPVVDSERTTLQEALAQLEVLTADMRRPMNLFDLIEFNRRGAEMIRAKAPVPAAMMLSTANALERAYCQQ